MGSPTIKDVIELNKVVKVLKDSYDFKWNFVKHKDLKFDDLII